MENYTFLTLFTLLSLLLSGVTGSDSPQVQGRTLSAHSRVLVPEDHLALPPLASCHGPLETAASASAQCLERCPVQDKPHKLIGLQIFSARQSETIINISSCETYRYSQIFTESWLMSRSESQISRERIKTNLTQCELLFEKVCNKKACDTTIPSSLKPDYRWASEVTVISDISILTKHSALRYYSPEDGTITSGRMWIPNIKEEIIRSDSKYYHEETDRYFLWEPKILQDNECPVRDFTPSTCLELGDDGFWCDKLKIFLNKDQQEISISQCPEKFRRSGAYLYKTMSLTSVHLTDSKFIYDMVEGSSLNDLIHMINHVLKLRDTEHCIEDCLGIKHLMEPLSLILAGYTYYQKVNNTHVLPCEPEFRCKLKIPISACQLPAMVRVECDSGDSWFRLDRGTTIKYEHCSKPYFPGSGEMIIPSNLGNVIINKSGLYLDEIVSGGKIAHPDPLSNPHQTGNFIRLKDPTRYHEIKEASDVITKTNTKKSFSFEKIGSLIQFPIVWIREQLALIEDRVKFIILAILGLFFGITTLRVYLGRKSRKRDFPQNRNNPNIVEGRDSVSSSSQESPLVPRYQISG